MLRTIKIILFLIICTRGWGQVNETRQSILSQLTESIKLQSENYSLISFKEPILWDTSEFVFKKYLTRIDTADQTDLAVKHGPTRRRIISFSKMVTSSDYSAFRDQVFNQQFDRFDIGGEIKGSKKLKEKMEVRFSQPLVTVDGKIGVVKEIRKYSSGGYRRVITVYKKKDDRWIIWGNLSVEQSSIR